MKEDYYLSLIAKSLSSETTVEEENELNAWISASSDNKNIYSEYKNIWEYSERDSDFEPDVQLAFEKFEQEIEKLEAPKVFPLQSTVKKSNWKLIAGIAASILLVFGSILYSEKSSTDDKVIVFASSSSPITKKLPDGSECIMNSNSKISFKSSFESRDIELVGEAFFNIKKDASHPFQIYCDVSIIKVLGTSFNVKTLLENKMVIVTVATGIVEISTTVDNQIVKITKNDKAYINLETGEISLKKDTKLNAISWKEDELIFENETMENIAEAIGNHFKIKVIVSDEIKNCRFSSEFKHPKLEEIIELFENYFIITKLRDEEGIQITGTSCD